ncbi:hypothetical protein ACUC97_31770, partial [Escherichia coli]|uniref:hypothetical protein n=1 Tax=Escherichia coli TaxID=562 RepID=UPI00403CB22B
ADFRALPTSAEVFSYFWGSGELLSLSGTASAEAAGRFAPLIPDNSSPVTYRNSTNTLTPETTARISTSHNPCTPFCVSP